MKLKQQKNIKGTSKTHRIPDAYVKFAYQFKLPKLLIG